MVTAPPHRPQHELAEMKKSGAAPMVHGFLISALVVLVALAVEYFMGILPF